MILKDFLIGFSTVNVEYDILVEKQGFGDRSVREKSLFFESPKKSTVCAKVVRCYVHRPLRSPAGSMAQLQGCNVLTDSTS